MAWLGRGAPEADFGGSGRGPPRSGGKVAVGVKRLITEWPGLDEGLPEADFGGKDLRSEASFLLPVTRIGAPGLHFC